MLSLLLAMLFVPPAMVLLILAAIKLWELAWPFILVAVLLIVIVVIRLFVASQSWRWR